MTTTKALFSSTLLLVVLETPLWSQARPFVGRLVSREYSIENNCSTQKPPPQILGLGLNPLPKLPDCEYIFANGTSRTTKPSYSNFNVDFPATTPSGVMNPSGASATVEFSQLLTFRVATNVGWSLSPPEGQTTGTHLANYSLEVEQFASDLGSCTGSNTSTNGSGSLILDGSCSMRRTAGAWNPATQTARQIISAAVGFRFGGANGQYTVRIRAIYDFSALDVDHIEVLQTVQTADNRVPLVAGKASMVRVFPATAPGSAARLFTITIQRTAAHFRE